MIYTTYFAKLKRIPENVVPISICGKSPTGYKGFEFKHLAPRYSFFKEWKENHDNDYYAERYYAEVLANLDATTVVNNLYMISGGMDIALVCYEKTGSFCHRHLVAKWLNDNGYPCTEIEM